MATAELKKGDVKDMGLAEAGKRKIEWAGQQMPVLQQIRKRFIKEQPLKGLQRVTGRRCCDCLRRDGNRDDAATVALLMEISQIESVVFDLLLGLATVALLLGFELNAANCVGCEKHRVNTATSPGNWVFEKQCPMRRSIVIFDKRSRLLSLASRFQPATPWSACALTPRTRSLHSRQSASRESASGHLPGIRRG